MKLFLMLVIAAVLLVEFSHEARVPSKISGRPSRKKPGVLKGTKPSAGSGPERPPKGEYETSGKKPPKGEGEGGEGEEEGNYEGEEGEEGGEENGEEEGGYEDEEEEEEGGEGEEEE